MPRIRSMSAASGRRSRRAARWPSRSAAARARADADGEADARAPDERARGYRGRVGRCRGGGRRRKRRQQAHIEVGDRRGRPSGSTGASKSTTGRARGSASAPATTGLTIKAAKAPGRGVMRAALARAEPSAIVMPAASAGRASSEQSVTRLIGRRPWRRPAPPLDQEDVAGGDGVDQHPADARPLEHGLDVDGAAEHEAGLQPDHRHDANERHCERRDRR